jgi:hypothetical protein
MDPPGVGKLAMLVMIADLRERNEHTMRSWDPGRVLEATIIIGPETLAVKRQFLMSSN